MPSPTIYLIAGCNGAGKTTFAKEFLPHEVKCLRFYNADEIARGLFRQAMNWSCIISGCRTSSRRSRGCDAGCGWEDTMCRSQIFAVPGVASKTSATDD